MQNLDFFIIRTMVAKATRDALLMQRYLNLHDAQKVANPTLWKY
jgi:hypothetical protein